MFRAENIRLQDEYYSLKGRLTNALDHAQELQRKIQHIQHENSDLHTAHTALVNDAAAKDDSIAFLKVDSVSSTVYSMIIQVHMMNIYIVIALLHWICCSRKWSSLSGR